MDEAITKDEASANAAIPSPEALIDRATAMIPTLKSRAAECEQLRKLPPETVEDLRRARFIRVCMLKQFGGYEMNWGVF